MTIRFHPPGDQAAYSEKVLALLLEAALPAARAQLEGLLREEEAPRESENP